MKAGRTIAATLLLGLLLFVPCTRAQQPDTPPTQDPGAENGTPVQGEEVPTLARTPQNDRGPVSGVEDYRLDGLNLGRSFVTGTVQGRETYDTNTNSSSTKSKASQDSVTNLLGSISLQKLARTTALNLDYTGALFLYASGSLSEGTAHKFNVTEKFYLRRWTLLLGDDFSFLPESAAGLGGLGFGGGSGIPGLGGGLTNYNPFLLPGQSIQSLGNRINNVIVGQVQYTIGPRSSFNFSSNYGLVHFFTLGLLNSRSLGMRVGYDYLLDARQTFTLAYVNDFFSYSSALPGFSTHSAVAAYKRFLTGRLSFLVEGGPQISRFKNPISGNATSLSWRLRSQLRHLTARNSMEFDYLHHITAGSGVLIGANSDMLRTDYSRILSRNWTAGILGSFSRNSGLRQTSGINTNRHSNSWTAGTTIHRLLGERANIDLTYHISRQTANFSVCPGNIPCGSVSLRHQVGVGMTWSSRPYLID